MARSRYEADQIVFRWDSENAVGTTGFGPVAWSGPRDEVETLFQIYGALLRASGDETRPALLRVEQRAGVVLIRRTPWRDPGGRASVICHALVGSPELLDPALCLGLHAWDWEGAELPSARVRGALPVVPREVLAASAGAGLRALDMALLGAERELTGAVAELLRYPQARFTLLDERGDTACAVLRGLHGMFGDVPRPRRWTFASHDTAELPKLRYVFVGRWAGAASRNTDRRRVDPLERVGDRAEELAARLVHHHLRGGPEGAVATALREAQGMGDLPLLETAERALTRLEAPRVRGAARGPQADGDGNVPGARETGLHGDPRAPRVPHAAYDHDPRHPAPHGGQPDRREGPRLYREEPGPGAASEAREGTGLYQEDPGPGAADGGREGPGLYRDDPGPGAAHGGRDGSGLYRDASDVHAPRVSQAEPGRPEGAREAEEPPRLYGDASGVHAPRVSQAEPGRPEGAREAEEPPRLYGDASGVHAPGVSRAEPGLPEGAREARDGSGLYRDVPDGSATAREVPEAPRPAPRQAPAGSEAVGVVPVVAPVWRGPEGARSWWRAVRSWRRGRPVETGLVQWLAAGTEDAEARIRAGGDGELLAALGAPRPYPVLTLLMREVARRLPTWSRPLRREFRDLVIDHELFVTAPRAPHPTEPTEAERAANAAALHRWAVRPLLDEGDRPAAGVLVALLSRLHSSPHPAARSAFRQIVDDERPGLPEEVWRGLLQAAYAGTQPPRPTSPPAPPAPPAPAPAPPPREPAAPPAPPPPQEPSGGDGQLVALTLLALMVTLLAVIVAISVT